MLKIYHSNKLDILQNFISDVINKNPLSNPFEKEIIIFQSPGIVQAQWLQLELAKSLGIAANISFPLLSDFLWKMFSKVLSDIPAENYLTKEVMTWQLMGILPTVLHEPEFEILNQFLDLEIDINLEKNEFSLYKFSIHIAELFDRYLLYRPEWLESWHNKQLVNGLSNHQKWQKRLWLLLINYNEQLIPSNWYLPEIYFKFIQYLNNPNFINKEINFPKRIFVFGMTSLPPIYLQILDAISHHVDIYLMCINPCHYYYNEINNHFSLIKLKNIQCQLQNNNDHKNISINNEKKSKLLILNNYNENKLIVHPHPLLASWGKLWLDSLYFIDNLNISNEIDAFVTLSSECLCLLHQIQQDILDLEDHSYSKLGLNKDKKYLDQSFFKRRLNKNDKSLTFHACSSKKREVEVLQDYLLHLFEEEPSVTPKDIIVMVVDIDSYTPYIQATFSNITPERYLPFSISDRKISQIYPILKTFLSILDLPHSRFTTEQVFSLLEVPILARKFSIDDHELVILRRWIKESGIRWGLDNNNIEMLGLPATGQNTWSFGLNRMILGYAMDSNLGIWNNILPYDGSTGLSAQLAGKLASFIDLLSSWQKILNQTKKLTEWLPLCNYIIKDFFHLDKKNEPIFSFILEQWSEIVKTGIASKYENYISVSLIRENLVTSFDKKTVNQRFLATDAINFCSFMPMIPFKVVCLLGMNDGIYPRIVPQFKWDLMAEQPQRGDLKSIDDDNYLFLTALIYASKRFYLSYIYDDQANANPSLLINELLDYISYSFYIVSDEHLNVHDSVNLIKDQLVTKHTRVPFAMENYLPDSIHQSYAVEWLSTAAAAVNKKYKKSFVFCSTSLEKNKDDKNEIFLEKLLSFYQHPIRAFFKQRLKVNFVNEEIQLPQEEPFIVNNLQRYQFNEYVLNALILGEPIEKIFNTIRATGLLPVENFGMIYWENEIQDMQRLAAKIKINCREYFNKSVIVSFDTIKLVGHLRNIQSHGIIRYRPAKLTVNDGLSLWIEHLVFCSTINYGKSYYWGRNNSEWNFEPIDKYKAKAYLKQLINGYQLGMNSPLPLFNKSCWNWLMTCYDKNKNIFNFKSNCVLKKAHEKLIQSLQGTYNQPGEIFDIYINRVFNKIENNLLNIIKKNTLIYLLPMAISTTQNISWARARKNSKDKLKK